MKVKTTKELRARGEVKYINMEEFITEGYLQEVNRQFFHPLGLALEVICDDNGVPERLGGIWDYRDDSEGMRYGKCDIEEAKRKAIYVSREQTRKKKPRIDSLGYVVQPIEDMGK